jgi:cytoplasmic iron level regulating protein YaaA (DUF328/UPF0246 family)
MLLLLPPSETKRDGGAGHGTPDARTLDLGSLGFPELTRPRKRTVAALRALSRNVGQATAALGLGPTQRHEIERNRAIATSAVMPAIERYTGVLYDALGAHSFGEAQRRFAAEHVVIGSALFGLVRAGDGIPAYRLSHDSRLPGLGLRRHWSEHVSPVLAAQPGLMLDLRSEAYAALGPAPATACYVRVVSDDLSGRRVALSHFNKKSKGDFTRAVIEARIDHDSADSLLEWAAAVGIRLERGAPGELQLVV